MRDKETALKATHKALTDVLVLLRMRLPGVVASDPGCREAIEVLRKNRDEHELPLRACFSEHRFT
jgi:hypothetical protein